MPGVAVLAVFLAIVALLALAPASDAATVDETVNLTINESGVRLQGVSVAVDGDHALVGARENGTDVTFVYERNALGNWTQEATLLPDGGDTATMFGRALALDDGTALVGAHTENHGSEMSAGSAYVFVRDPNGTWVKQAELIGSDTEAYDRFGISVALHNDTAVVGAYRDTPGGSAYAFTRDQHGNWSQQAKLVPDDPGNTNRFGISVALDQSTALVGDDEGVSDGDETGTTYVFTRNATGDWDQQAKLVASDQDEYARFGASVAIDGDRTIVGAPDTEYWRSGRQLGAAYIFEQDGTGSWAETQELVPEDVDEGISDDVGYAVALDGDTALVTDYQALNETDSYSSDDLAHGAVYLFQKRYGTFQEDTKWVASDSEQEAYFGFAASLGDGVAVVGGPLQDNATAADVGAAYVFSAPGVPQNLTAVPGSGVDHIDLSWEAPDGLVPIEHYRIRGGTDPGGPYDDKSFTSIDTFEVTGAVANTTHYFVVSARADNGLTSPASNEASSSATPPPEATNFTVEPGPYTDTIQVDWDPPPDGLCAGCDYVVRRATTAGGPYTVIHEGNDETEERDYLDANQTYYYVVVVESHAGLTSSPTPEASSRPAVPPTPPDLRATPGAEAGTIQLDWEDDSSVEVYHIERATSPSGPYTEIANTTEIEYADADVDEATYHYRVIAESWAGMLSSPATVVADPRPPAPVDLVAAEGSQTGEIELDWDPPTGFNGAITYRVFRSTQDGGPYELVDTGETTGFMDETLEPGTYYYVVTTVDAAGMESPLSAQTSAQAAVVPTSPGVSEPPAPSEPGSDTAQNDAGTGGDASDDPSDPTMLAGGTLIHINGTLIAVEDPIDAYGTRISPNATISMGFNFTAPASMGLELRLIDPGGLVRDTDTAPLEGGDVEVTVEAAPGEHLQEGVWVTVLEHGLADGEPALSATSPWALPASTSASTWDRVSSPAPVTFPAGPTAFDTPIAGDGTLPGQVPAQFAVIDYRDERPCDPHC